MTPAAQPWKTPAVEELPDGWKQYAARAEGDFGDYYQRDDGNAEVFANPDTDGWHVKVWRPYKYGPHKRSGATGRMVLLSGGLDSATQAMALADGELPMVAEVAKGGSYVRAGGEG